MIYDGVDLSGFVRVEYVTKRALPAISYETTTIAGVDGARVRGVTLDPLELRVGLRILAPTKGWRAQRQELEDKRRRLSQILFKRRPCPLIFDFPDDVEYMAIVTDAGELTRELCSMTFEVTFMCPDPVAFGKTREVDVGRSGVVVIDGNYPTYPVFEVASTSGACVLNVDGVTFQTIGAMTGADPIVIDCNPDPVTHEAITYKGDSEVAISINSDYFALEPGTHAVACDAPVKVRWCERWL